MSRLHLRCPSSDASDCLVAADVLVREEPEEDEEEEDEDDGKAADDEDNGDGYSE